MQVVYFDARFMTHIMHYNDVSIDTIGVNKNLIHTRNPEVVCLRQTEIGRGASQLSSSSWHFRF